MLAAQKGCCAVCGADSPGEKDWNIDHDHKTGALRGLLCCRCNPGLGNFRDSPDLLERAAAYLRKHGAK